MFMTPSHTLASEKNSKRKNTARLAVVVVAMAGVLAVLAVREWSGTELEGGQMERKVKMMETLTPMGENFKTKCGRKLANEWPPTGLGNAKLSEWMQKYPQRFSGATVYDSDEFENERATGLNRFDVSDASEFGKNQYRVQEVPVNMTESLLVWEDNTVARVDSVKCRVTGVYYPTKNGHLDGRIASVVRVRSDACGEYSVCERTEMSGTCTNPTKSCPAHFSYKSHHSCSYDGSCFLCGCVPIGVCRCSNCPAATCPVHFDQNCPLRSSLPCQTNINLGGTDSSNREAQVVEVLVGFVSAASNALPPMISTPIQIVAFVVGQSVSKEDSVYNALVKNVEQAISNLRRCIKADIADLVRTLGVQRDIDAVKGKLLPSRLHSQTAQEREKENHWLIAREGCNDLGDLYERYRLTSDWHIAAVLLPTMVEAVELCGMVYASMVSDLVVLGHTTGTRLRNVRLDFEDMMRLTITAMHKWIDFLEDKFYTNGLCGRFPDLRALVPPMVKGYRHNVAIPVLNVAAPIVYGRQVIKIEIRSFEGYAVDVSSTASGVAFHTFHDYQHTTQTFYANVETGYTSAWTRVQNVHTKKVWELKGRKVVQEAGRADGSHCSQLWKFIFVSGHVYTIKNKCTNLCLDLGATGINVDLLVHTCHATSSGAQRWSVRSIRTVRMISAGGPAVDMSNYNEGTQFVLYHNNGINMQAQLLELVIGGRTRIRDFITKKYMTLAGGKIVQKDALFGSSACLQYFQVIAKAGTRDKYSVQSTCYNSCVDLKSYHIHAGVVYAACHWHSAQIWTFDFVF